MSFIINPRVLSVLSLAVVSVAGEWTGGYNTTFVSPRADPAGKCWITSLDPSRGSPTAVYPCTCTGGKVSADCNWYQAKMIYNAVRDADCKCATTGDLSKQPKELQEFGKSKPNAVTQCICDPAEDGKGKPGADGLVVPTSNCWCPAESLKQNSGLKEAKEGEAVMEEPAAPVDAAAVQKCSTELVNSTLVKPNVCALLKEKKPTEMTEYMQGLIPSCTIALLDEICKSN
ncbi:hypothetical protein BBO_05760 [Beauveria brongniartii RCEF 3172]|uniref:Uncharacterized protein n=1 Tax=Beauveria brongniartii RCEF 3172 TaxID=1081107 RepID=A0A167CI58_9HYPO|nr:hypothetical protein BBO_05760 [Beauveria brongniartii RCEF 3172]